VDIITFFVGLWISIAVFLLLATHLDYTERADSCDPAGDGDA